MKRLLFLTLNLILSSIVSMAQNKVLDNPENKTHFGVRIGGELAFPSKVSYPTYGMGDIDIDLFNTGCGAELGIICNCPIVANLYVEPGVKLFYDSFSVKKGVIGYITDDYLFQSLSFRKFGLRIPMMFGYHFDFTDDFKFHLFTGPELEAGFIGKEFYSGLINEDYDLYDDGFKRVNLRWCVGTGFSYRHFYFSITGGLGMLNMISDSDAKLHENRLSFNIGCNI